MRLEIGAVFALTALLFVSVGAAQSSAPVSTIRLPLSVDLGRATQAAEAAIPRIIDQTGEWQPVRAGVVTKYQITRQPLAVRADGNRIVTVVEAAYSVRVGQSIAGRVATLASCGLPPEAPRRVRATIETTIDFDRNWQLAPQSRLAQIDYLDRCEVTALGIDVTQLIDRALRPRVEQALVDLDAQLRQTDVRGRVEQIWRTLTTPVKVADGTWLVIEPRRVGLGPIAGSGASVSTTLALDAVTRVVFAEPASAATPPLPPLERVADGSGFRLVLEGAVPFARITEQLRAEIVGKPFEYEGQRVVVSDIRASAEGDRISIRATFVEPIELEGTVVGRLVYDAQTRTLVAEELDLSAESRSALTNTLLANVLGSPDFKARIERGARLPIGETIDGLERAATGALNRRISDALTLGGEVTRIEPELLGVEPGGDAYRLRVTATGNARLVAR